MIPTQSHNAVLANFLARVSLTPNRRVLNDTLQKFFTAYPHGFPLQQITITDDITRRIFLAKRTLRCMADIPEELQQLMSQIQEVLYQKLKITPVLISHLQKLTHGANFEYSRCNAYMEVFNRCGTTISFTDLYYLIGSDWNANYTLSSECDPSETLQSFYNLIYISTLADTSVQSSLWKSTDFAFQANILSIYLSKVKSGEFPLFVANDLLRLKDSQNIQTYYVPIGYATTSVFCISLIAIDYVADGYRLRLLISDGNEILAAGDKLHYFCPEVIWTGLSLQQLLDYSMWMPLLEAATLEKNESTILLPSEQEEYLVYNSEFLVTWLTQKLGKRPLNVPFVFSESDWDYALKHPYNPPSYVVHSLNVNSPSNGEGVGALMPTGKQIKRPVYYNHMRKFVHLLALDCLPTKNDVLLYKSEMRLMSLIGAYMDMKSGFTSHAKRGNYVRMIEQSFGKVTVPLETLMQNKPTENQRKAALILMATLLDLKHRIADLVSKDCSLLAVDLHYPSTYHPHRLNLSDVYWRPIKQTVIDTLRLNEGLAPLPHEIQWTVEKFPMLYESLEAWYTLLLDAKNKCEPMELLMMAHRNIFSRLPIPTTANVEDTFPDQLSEGLQVGTLLLIKRISSLIASEIYSDPLISPLFVADMTRVYRFVVELYSKVNPEIRQLPISWYCLHQYLNSRHSFHVPGEIIATLKSLEESFKLLSPTGYQCPSEQFKEIPVFYFSWDSYPKEYRLHRKQLNSCIFNNVTVEEVLNVAELADSVALNPNETSDSELSRNEIKWQNSFGGQCFLILEHIAQMYTMGFLATSEAHQLAISKKRFREYVLEEKLGPQDHFLLPPVSVVDLSKHINRFGGFQEKYAKQVEEGKMPMSMRMVVLKESMIRESISHLPVTLTDEWRDQSELIKSLPKGDVQKTGYQFHQAASGPFELSLDVLFEYFELRPALLLNQDYRSYFWAIIRSAHVMETAISNEPLLLNRLKSFILILFHEDQKQLIENALHFERMLWLSDLTTYVCRFGGLALETFNPVLQELMQFFYGLTSGLSLVVRLAPRMIICQQMLREETRLSLPELARMFLLIGRQPPSDPNDAMLWIDVCEAMQSLAPKIIHGLFEGDEFTRFRLWSLILSSEEEIKEVMQRQPHRMTLTTLANTSAEMQKLLMKQRNYEKWISFSKRVHWRSHAWREHAVSKLLIRVIEETATVITSINDQLGQLLGSAEQLLCFSPTSLLLQISGRIITVDWESGRISGGGNDLPAGRLLPVYLRKHPDFSLFGQMTKRPIEKSTDDHHVHFKDLEIVKIDIATGTAWLHYEGREFCFVSSSQVYAVDLPETIREGFSVWLNRSEEHTLQGIVAAHGNDGIPRPFFSIDPAGEIHPLIGNTHLRLGREDFYSEADFFSRWGILQHHLLIWLDEHSRVAEVHLPLKNGREGHFTRLIRQPNGSWLIGGLDLILEEVTESVPAFAGHPVYLIARNHEGQKVLLLPGVSPYDIDERRDGRKYQVDWNLLLAHGENERIHQYRLLPTGQVEGLTVSDNLLLMQWMLYMGRFSATAELIKRWISPPGRPYTPEEENILLPWIVKEFGEKSKMIKERHPSAQNLRLLVITKMRRHLRDYHPRSIKGEQQSRLWLALVGSEKKHTYTTKRNIEEELLHNRAPFASQIRATAISHLFSPYDQELAIRLGSKCYRGRGGFETRLFQRLTQTNFENQQHTLNLTLQVHGRVIVDHLEWGNWKFKSMCKSYPTTVQREDLPIDTLYRRTVTLNLIEYFDKAYNLVKEGNAQDPQYVAIVYAIEQLQGQKCLDLCFNYLSFPMGYYYSEDINERNLILWLILIQAYIAKKAGKELPELPSLERRFGLATQASNTAAKAFFHQIISFSGMTINTLFQKYQTEWFDKRGMRFLEQSKIEFKAPDSFVTALKEPWSHQLIKEIMRWSRLSTPLKIDQKHSFDELEWTFSVPIEWSKTTLTRERLTDLQFTLQDYLAVVSREKTTRETQLLQLANALPENPDKALLEFARQIHSVSPCSVDECIGLALINRNHTWQERSPSTPSHILQEAVLFYLEVALEEAHLKRLQIKLKRCLECPEDADEPRQLMEAVTTVHRYKPSSATLPLMVAEYYSDCRMRIQPDQAQLIHILTRESSLKSKENDHTALDSSKGDAHIQQLSEIHKGSIIQAIMGSGKSKMLAPVWLQMMLGTGRLPILCVPTSLFRTTLTDLQKMMWERFRTHVRALNFDRESCTKQKLFSLAETLYIARHEQTVFVCTPRDLHALQLMLKERHQIMEEMRGRLKHFTLTWAKSCLGPKMYPLFERYLNQDNWDFAKDYVPLSHLNAYQRWEKSHTTMEGELTPILEEANLLQSILNLLQFEGALLVDEVATVYDPRNLLSFPIGWQVPANPHATTMACKVYFKWLPKQFDKLDLLNNMQSLSSPETRQEVYEGIAKNAWKEYRMQRSIRLVGMKSFMAYLYSHRNGQKMKNTIDMLAQSNNMFQRQCAQELAFLKYCLTTGLEGTLTSTAFVNYGRSKQNPGLHLAIPYECANVPKENTVFRRPWKTLLATCQYYNQVWQDPLQTSELLAFLLGIDPLSKDGKILKAAEKVWGPRFSETDLADSQALEVLTLKLDQARLNPENAKEARMLIQTFLQWCVFPTQLKLDPSQMTSTPQDIPVLTDKADAMGGTFGFQRTWNPKQVRVPDLSSDATILRVLREERNQKCHQIARGGAVALLEAFASGEFDEYMALMDAGALFKGVSNTKVAERIFKTVNGFDCVLFYDEEQSGGARLALISAHGKQLLEHSDHEGVKRVLTQLVLFKPFVFFDQARCIGADLELPPGKALITFSDATTQDGVFQAGGRCRFLVDGRHSVGYAIPGEMGDNWTGDRVLESAKIRQDQIEEKANFQGICEQLRGHVRAVIDHQMRSTADSNKRHAIHTAARQLMMEQQENDLVKTFGALQGMVRSHDALQQLVQRLVEQVANVLPEYQEKVKNTLADLMEWHCNERTPLPEWVRLGDEEEDSAQEVDLSKDQDRLRLMEEEYERMLGTRNPKKEIDWSQFDRQTIKASPIGCVSEVNGMPPLYKLREALNERGFNVPFSGKILISANLLSTFLGESNCLLTENQKPVHRGLFVRENGISRYVLVSEGDARFLKQHLLELPEGEKTGIYLVEPSGMINQRGCLEEEVVNLWRDGSKEERQLLLMALLFQGSALMIDRLPKREVQRALREMMHDKLNRLSSVRCLFEAALERRADDMHHYRRSPHLRRLFVCTN